MAFGSFYTQQPMQGGDDQLHIVRERQWMYLGPIAAAPLAHICVTLYRDAKTPLQKRMVIGGVIGSTFLAVGMRLVLMAHAGYPGGPNSQMAERERVVTSQQKYEIENAKVSEIAREAARGFG
eukprot:Nitzschia sp. Nitz4//scaffold109_size72162//53651//54019//NITZ4_005854-RA/size72162-processed-gene-0.19-mRNA-1//1//CDS//3329532787//1503//frame0